MNNPFYLLIVFLFLSIHSIHAQVPLPERRPWNIGISNGLGGVSYSFFPSLDLGYKTTSLRVSPGFIDFAVGVTQEIFPVSEVYYQWKWVVSAYHVRSRQNGMWPGVGTFDIAPDHVNRYAGLTGLKLLFGSRFYSYLQFGVIYSRYGTIEEEIAGGIIRTRQAFNEWMPYLEFSIGFNFFRNYSREIEYAD